MFMKKLLLVSAVACCTIAANAQKIEVGLNGGALPFTTIGKYAPADKETPGYYAGARMSVRTGSWQIGSGVDHFGRSSESTTNNEYVSSVTRRKYNTVAPYLFLNRVVQLSNSYLYAGINAGMNITKFTKNGEEISKTNDVGNCGFGMNYETRNLGFNGGVQAGYTMRVYKGFSANVEAGARYVRMSSGGANYGESQMTFPMSVGIRYDMSMCPKMCCKKKAAGTDVQP
jgi:hypothetical protein